MKFARIAGIAGAFALMLSFNASSGIDSLTSAVNLYQQFGGATPSTSSRVVCWARRRRTRGSPV